MVEWHLPRYGLQSGHKFMLNDILRKKRKSKTHKPECPVFLTYGPAHDSPLGWIKRWKEDIICIRQRLRYGYCYRDVWSIDWWFVTVVPNMIHDLRINSHGYPGYFTGTEEENVRKWNRILKRMEFLFREANEETCRRKNPYQDAHKFALKKHYGRRKPCRKLHRLMQIRCWEAWKKTRHSG